MRLCELLEGEVQSMQQPLGEGGSGGMFPRKFDVGPFIRHSLVESGTVFAQT